MSFSSRMIFFRVLRTIYKKKTLKFRLNFYKSMSLLIHFGGIFWVGLCLSDIMDEMMLSTAGVLRKTIRRE